MKTLLKVTLLSLALAACGGAQKAPEGAALAKASVRVTRAREVTQPIGDEVVGTVRARNVTAVSASVMGTVRALKVGLGSRVRAGDVLISLSAGEIEAKANQARAIFSQASLDMKRAEQLKASQSISSSQYDSAAAQFQVAEANLAEANVMQGYTLIRAPISGVVTAKECNVGDLALPGKPLLVLESPGQLRLEASVPEAIAHFIHAGDDLTVRIDALGRELSATVSEVSPSADPVSRTLLVKLDLPESPELRAGMFGRLMVRTGEAKAVLVPSSALVQRGQMETLFVVERGVAHLRLVRSGRLRDGSVEVLAGIEPGETIVAEHPERLVDGQPVEVKP